MNEVLADETLAGEIAAAAKAVERDGCFGEAEALRVVARHYRIRGLEARSQFASLFEAYRRLQACLDSSSDRTPE
ncbi:hypothetical protein [Methylobacterium radiotolerans]|uniref:hypothetical protein n=1 Tax=Methylobacterium radiotolerans TaxID=31998 RepID=UPI001F31035E|nr:hypothetical protein [Methylobacterium radiotolerans]UIY43523.1 hypothetical protein LZ599_07435 [Methylobacterium radiotolerans]